MIRHHSTGAYHRPLPDSTGQYRSTAPDHHVIFYDGLKQLHRRGVYGRE
jgi:hypothetical protein